MSNKRNENLAIQMGWKKFKHGDIFGKPIWVRPGKPYRVAFCMALPDFCGDDCAAVKWLLPFLDGLFLYWRIERVSIGSEDRKLYFTGRTQGVSGLDVCVSADSLSRVLTAAMESFK